MSKVRLTTELPIPAERAAALARKPEVMAYVMSPVLRLYRLDVPDTIEVGSQGSARLWWFGVIPAWTHHLTVERLGATEIYTHEHGGPVHTWNHLLTFEAIDDQRCRYTDEVETDDGLRGAPTRLFIRLMFRHRHRRWHRLVRRSGPVRPRPGAAAAG
jgi:ligand-binding SRPBCC domain-containing protein